MSVTPCLPPVIEPWYVVHTRTLKEQLTATSLHEHLGLTTYVPQLRQRTRDSMRPVAFFPGYLFIQADLRRVPVSSINSCPGVLCLLTLAGIPQPVSPNVIRAVHEGVDRLNACAGQAVHTFQPGASVRVKAGPLAGLDAIFVGSRTPQHRVHILLQLLGGVRPVQLDAAWLEPAPAPTPSPPHKRGTRGHGRSVC
jgi:transcriptional antiterminator RfaH